MPKHFYSWVCYKLYETFQPSQALKNLSSLCEDGKALQRSLGGTRRVVATCKMSVFFVLRTDTHRLWSRFRKSLLATKIKSMPSILILLSFFLPFKQYWWLLLRDANLSLTLFGVLGSLWGANVEVRKNVFAGECRSYRMPYWNCLSQSISLQGGFSLHLSSQE